ncbi:hypothetical protein [Haemophilus influenzae]|uniref:hypothetical protein n=1 Tax=Haemophilus influenzae TaxID=727 RepID=UPI001864FF2E|nr:hypothetical protein [Haemophilus influenzae]MCK9053270.1 hypothetical protein [Haemophilus influenzae]MCK9061975.1 hypothetical protein [Haemophilus influenzae]MCK9079886.1 hypothetical protein [Haemophilus influenzae]MCK9118869.1 hypothetical protein [Haemophilus influenzae]BBF07145.1 hypothetical protein CHBNIII7_10280 [Haemophilus influenzae]
MSIICEIDQILINNKDYFILKSKEFKENYQKSKEKQISDSEKFPLYSKNKNHEYEE